MFPKAQSLFIERKWSSTVALPDRAKVDSQSPENWMAWNDKSGRVVFFDQMEKIPKDEIVQVTYQMSK